jgi:hypothetical protein
MRTAACVCGVLAVTMGLIAPVAAAATPAELFKQLEDRGVQAKALPEKVKAAADPVAAAVQAAKDTVPGLEGLLTPLSLAGMDLLVEYADDPRAEATLLEIRSQPGSMSVSPTTIRAIRELYMLEVGYKNAARLSRTPLEIANMDLIEVRTRKGVKAVLAGATTPDEKVKAIRKAFQEHPEWLTGTDNFVKAQKERLMKEAAAAGGGSAADLVLRCGEMNIMADFARRYPDESLAFVAKLGPEELRRFPDNRNVPSWTRNEKAIPIIQAWLKEETNKSIVEGLMNGFPSLPSGRKALEDYLKDPRSVVSDAAAQTLAYHMPGEESDKAIEAEVARRKAAGASADDLKSMTYMVEMARRPASMGGASKPRVAQDVHKAEAEAFREKVKTDKDPTALAIAAFKDETPGDPEQVNALNQAGLEWLLEHPDDPRIKAALEELSKGPPKREGYTKTYLAMMGLQGLKAVNSMNEAQGLIAKVRTAPDGAALAVAAAKDKSVSPLMGGSGFLVMAGMNILFLMYPDDPRTEATLEQLTKGPIIRETETPGMVAAGLLNELRQQKAAKGVIDKAGTPNAKVAAIRKAFADNPEWLTKPENEGKRMSLMREAIDAGGGSVADLVIQSGNWQFLAGYAKKYPAEYVAAARKAGREKVMTYAYCTDGMRAARSPEALEMLLEWIKEEKDNDALRHMTVDLVAHPGAEKAYRDLLSDERSGVYVAAVVSLAQSFPSESNLAAIEAEIARRKAAGMKDNQLQAFTNAAAEIRDHIKRNGPKPTGTPGGK